ncbi:alpha/beta hydrolase [Kordiimonas pumila]|uniref:Alpha/beta hydrolase n=1 Tax=Kordiimonas pumila TaxID=2161677 RepID=A0ABV7D7J6_9PROT|nr:alpha/beta hydrolase [Kordiimonas pumila]
MIYDKTISLVVATLLSFTLAACSDTENRGDQASQLVEQGMAPASGPLTKRTPTADEQKYVDFRTQPNSAFEALLTDPPVVIDGQTLHPKLQWEYEKDKKEPEKDRRASLIKTMNDEAAKNRLRGIVDIYWDITTKETPPMAAVYDMAIEGPDHTSLPIRIYVPDVDTGEEKLPVLVYYHGGGYLFGSIQALDGAVRLIATEAKVIAVSVDYRLAPENPYPAFSLDAQAAFNWTVDNIAEYGGDPNNVSVGGDSAGGFLSVSTTIRQLESGGQVPAAHLLYYPALDKNYEDYPSYDLFKKGFGLDEGFMLAATEMAFQNVDANDPLISMNKYAHMDKMPPSIIASAGFDPIRDHGKVFAEKVTSAGGGAVDYKNYPSLTHGFLEASGTIDDAEEACLETARKFGELVRR